MVGHTQVVAGIWVDYSVFHTQHALNFFPTLCSQKERKKRKRGVHIYFTKISWPE